MRAFRPHNVTPPTPDRASTSWSPSCSDLDKTGEERLDAEAKEVMGLEEEEKCEEACGRARAEQGKIRSQQPLQLQQFSRGEESHDAGSEARKR